MSKSLKTVVPVSLPALVLAVFAAACVNSTVQQASPTPAASGTQTPAPTGTTTPTPTVQPGDDDERPPIIVSGGSVRLRAVAKNAGLGTNKAYGEWKPNGSKWFLQHGVEAPSHLIVHVMYGSGDAGCDDPATEFDVPELKIQYGAKTFNIFVDKPNPMAPRGPLATDAPGRPDPKIPHWFEIAGADRPSKVFLGPKTCDLDASKGEIHIYSRRK